MPAILDESGGMPLIRIEGDLNISTAAEFKSLLVKALASVTGLRLVLENAIDLDVTALQLLFAAETVAARSGTCITLEGRVPDELSATLSDAGFTKFQFQK